MTKLVNLFLQITPYRSLTTQTNKLQNNEIWFHTNYNDIVTPIYLYLVKFGKAYY